MTTHCDDLIPALVRAAEGSLDVLPAGERARLEAHLATCVSCAEALADQRAMRQALTELAAEPVTTFVGSRVMAHLRSDTPAATWLDSLDWRRWTWRLVPVAAALAIAVGSVAATTTTSTPAPDSETTVAGTMPVSSALVTGEVGGNDLLSLLLNSTADSALVMTTTTGGEQ